MVTEKSEPAIVPKKRGNAYGGKGWRGVNFVTDTTSSDTERSTDVPDWKYTIVEH